MPAAVLTESPPTPLPTTLVDNAGRAFTVRVIGPAEQPALEAFYEGFEPARAAQGLPPQGTARIRRWLERILPSGLHLAVERDAALVGHAMLIPTEDGGISEYAIFLHQGVRGQGLGTRLNVLAVEVARGQGASRLWLSVEPDNRAAIRSYEKAGWRYVPASLYASELEMELPL